jgi:hypothetical protein
MNTTKESPHGTNRMTAAIVGVLYIIGTVAGMLSVFFSQAILNGPDFLSKVSANENQFMIAALFVLLMGLALALVPVVLFPVLKKHNEALALGYVVFRGALETVSYIAMVITWFFLIIVSQEYIAAGAPDGSYFQTLGALLQKGNDSISTIVVIVFSLGALMLYYLLYRSKLIPRWISVFGFIAITLHLVTGFLIIFQLMSPFSTIDMIVEFPIFLQEMVMAVWLIAKGFNPAAIASLSAKTATNELVSAA